jgi:pectate lyase
MQVMKRTLFFAGFVVILIVYAVPVQAFETSPIGWATMSDGNVPYTITGGSAGPTVTVTDEPNFKNYATSTSPYVILVPTTITMTRETSSANTPQTVNIESNKTIIGIGSNPGIVGGFNISNKSNIIIRNLNISYVDNTQGSSDPWTDGITMQSGTHHVWVDHCNFFDSPDGLCDPTKQSNYITISWCKFYYTSANTSTHHFTCLVGSSDTDYDDRGKLKETFHHNWWTTNCKERMPRVRFGQVHVFNNYYSLLQSGGYCQGVGNECQIKVENNYYNAVPLPWKDYYKSPGNRGKIGWNTGNVFYNCSIPSGWTNDYNNMFVPPYSYTLNSGADINTIVPNGAGVDKLTPSPNPMTFSTAPYALSSSSIAMTATTASCADGVQYFFTCTAGGGHSSAWQSSTPYTDTGLAPDTNYTYTVQTRNLAQTIFTGAASSKASATTTSIDTTPPAIPTGLTAITGEANVPLDWNNNTEGDLAGYNVYRSTTQGSGYAKLNDSNLVSDPNYTDNNLPHNTTYYYVVRAVDTSSNESNSSNEVSGGLYGDFTGNKIVEMNDLPDFLDFWLAGVNDCNEAAEMDLDDNCIINFYEFAMLADNWLKEE